MQRLWRVKLKRLDLTALRIFIKFVPSERQRIFGLTILIGAFCGLAAVAFHLAIRFAENLFIDNASSPLRQNWVLWTVITPTIGGLLGGLLLTFVVPEARGSGIPQVKLAYLAKGGRLSFWRSSVGKFFVGVLQIGSGGSLGREGPTVQICCGIASTLGRAAALSRDNLRKLLPVGSAAGIAAAFNAPIAAVTFTIEEIVGDLDQTILSGIVIAAAIAAAIERGVLGEHPVFEVPPGNGLHYFSSLIFYVVLGVAAAAVSLVFSGFLLKLRSFFQKDLLIPAWMRPSIGGLVTGLLAAAGLLWLHSGGLTGGGYATLSEALAGNLTLKVLLALCILKIIATVFSYSSGGAGGIFAPSLFVGGTLGGAVGFLDAIVLHHPTSDVGGFALVGMGAVFAGVIRAPITSVLIIFEMTGSYGLILPLMISNMISYAIARHFQPTPIYDALLEQDGIFLPHNKGVGKHDILSTLRIYDAMTPDPFVLQANTGIKDAMQRIEGEQFSSFAVVDDTNKFLGFVTEARIRRTVVENAKPNPFLTDIMFGKTSAIFSEEPLVNAIIKMTQNDARQLAVISDAEEDKLIGIITMSDILRTQAQHVLGKGLNENTVLIETEVPNKQIP